MRCSSASFDYSRRSVCRGNHSRRVAVATLRSTTSRPTPPDCGGYGKAMDITDLAVRAAIADTLAKYCRGIDRLDPDLVREAFHDDGVLIDYGAPDPIPATLFADRAIESLRTKYEATQHRVTNTAVVEELPNRVVAESYILAFHVRDDDAGKSLLTFNGRWVDTFERRDDEHWRIAQRILRVDWTREDPWNEDMPGTYVFSARDRTDAVYG